MNLSRIFLTMLLLLSPVAAPAQNVSLTVPSSAASDFYAALSSVFGAPPVEAQEDLAAFEARLDALEARKIWMANSGNSSERVTTLPVPTAATSAHRRVIYSIPLPPLNVGDVVDIRGQFEVTNDLGFNVMIARQIVIATSATGATGLEVSEAAGQNVTPGMHHQINPDYGTFVVTSAMTGRFANMIGYAASSAASSGDTVDVEQDYGRLEVKVFPADMVSP